MAEHPFKPGQKVVVALKDLERHGDYITAWRKPLSGVLTVRNAFIEYETPLVTFEECPPSVEEGSGPGGYWQFAVFDSRGRNWFKLHGISSKADMEALYG
jgi:hypothetical protein